jgi:hypothetical protein
MRFRPRRRSMATARARFAAGELEEEVHSEENPRRSTMKARCSVALTILFTAIVGSSLRAGVQDPVVPTLRERARQNGGTYKETLWTTAALAPLSKLAAEADLIVEGRVATRTTKLNKEETAVLTVFTLSPERLFKDRLRLGTRPSPGPTEPLTFYEPGGTVEVDGLHITMAFRDATKPALAVGDEIIGFFVKNAETGLLRVHNWPYGLLRVRGGSVVATNDMVARTRPLEHPNLADVRADIQRLVADAARSK